MRRPRSRSLAAAGSSHCGSDGARSRPPATGPGRLPLTPQEMVPGNSPLVRYAEGDRHAVRQEDESPRRAKKSSRLRQPRRRVAPGRSTVFTDDEVEAPGPQRNPTRVRLHQREVELVTGSTPAGGRQLRRAQVHTDRPGPRRPSSPTGTPCRSRVPRRRGHERRRAVRLPPSGRRNRPQRIPSVAGSSSASHP